MKLIRPLMLTTLVASLTLAQPTPAPVAAPSTQPATQPADDAGARQALLTYNAAVEAADADKILACIQFTDDTQKKAMQLMGDLSVISDKLYKATVAKFGEEQMRKERISREQFQSGFPVIPLDQVQVKVSGDKAALVSDEGDVLPLSLTKTPAGDWKIDGAKLQAFTPEQFAEQKKMIDAAVKALSGLIDDVTAGHVRAPDEVAVLMKHRIGKAIREVQMAQIPPELLDPSSGPVPTPGPSTAPAGGAGAEPAPMK